VQLQGRDQASCGHLRQTDLLLLLLLRLLAGCSYLQGLHLLLLLLASLQRLQAHCLAESSDPSETG
jgi:hypothetical protein